jgi:acyl carrier protein
MITKQALIEALRKSLENEDVGFESDSENTEGWDSLGQLAILSELDKITNGKSSEIDDLATCMSVQQLTEKLKSINWLSD